jgi:hypothetical protein
MFALNALFSAEAVDLGPSWEIVDAPGAQAPVGAEPVNAGQIN